jgi:microcystin-dependent protein
MYQIDGPDVVSSKPAKKTADNPPGWFDGGNPDENQKATMVTRDWLNTIQAELKGAIEGAGIALNRGNDNQLLAAIKALVVTVVNTDPAVKISPSIPVGTIIAYYGSSAPEGFLACNGGSFSASKYPQLYSRLGKATTPNLQGCFLRGYQSGLTGSIGAVQQDAGRRLSGSLKSTSREPVLVEVSTSIASSGCLKATPTSASLGSSGNGDGSDLEFDSTWVWGAAHTANEFRPINVAVLYCVKHDD